MDFLVLAPPCCTPSEPPAGAFLLAAGLAGHGAHTGLLDLSLEFYRRTLDADAPGRPAALDYLERGARGRGWYDPHGHRSATGALHGSLRRFERDHAGWRLTLMDLSPPERVHDIRALAATLERGPSPFTRLCEETLPPVLEQHRPRRVLISLAYLSQLPAAIDLHRHLERLGVAPLVGGSLPGSLALTGNGLEELAPVFPRLDPGDGLSLVSSGARGRLVDRLAWPDIIGGWRYLSSRPILPLALSSGCFWNKCLFCPDRDLPFHPLPDATLDAFLASMPGELAAARPVAHLLDSALPPAQLSRFLPLARSHGLPFYGFARPDASLADESAVQSLAEAGCLMLQLGVESGSQKLLDRYHKGLEVETVRRALAAVTGAGIRTYLYLLFGLPGETEVDRRDTLRLLAEERESVDFLNLSLFNLPRHCELTRRAAEHEIEIADFPGRDEGLRLYWPFTLADGSSPRDEARHFLKEELHPHPAVREAVLRTPRWLRAAHLALMKIDGRRGP